MLGGRDKRQRGEQIDYSRPWKPRMDQYEEATLLFGQAHLPLPPTRPTNGVIIYLFVTRDASAIGRAALSFAALRNILQYRARRVAHLDVVGAIVTLREVTLFGGSLGRILSAG